MLHHIKALRLADAAFELLIRTQKLRAIDLVICNERGEILVGWRTNRPAKDCFFVPGGRIRSNESKADAFRRLTKAELGISLSIGTSECLGAYQHNYHKDNNFSDKDPSKDFDTQYNVEARIIRVNSRILKKLPKDQHVQYTWLSLRDMQRRGNVHPNTVQYAKDLCGRGEPKRHFPIRGADRWRARPVKLQPDA